MTDLHFFLFLVLLFQGCEKEVRMKIIETPGIVEAKSAPNELRENLQIVCVGGHSYYYAKWEEWYGSYKVGHTVFASKLEEDGTPSPCVLEKPEKKQEPKQDDEGDIHHVGR